MGSGRGWLAGDWPSTGAFSTLLRQSGLRASIGGVLATKSERKMYEYMLVLALCLVTNCLYSRPASCIAQPPNHEHFPPYTTFYHQDCFLDYISRTESSERIGFCFRFLSLFSVCGFMWLIKVAVRYPSAFHRMCMPNIRYCIVSYRIVSYRIVTPSVLVQRVYISCRACEDVVSGVRCRLRVHAQREVGEESQRRVE